MRSLALCLILGFSLTASASVSRAAESAKSSPPDTRPYSRSAVAADRVVRPAQAGAAVGVTVHLVRQVDTVVNNTDVNLKGTDSFNDGETSIAINPNNLNDIVISAFSGAWSSYPSYAPIWVTQDGGESWTKEFTVTQPFGVSGTSGCPCDQTFDYGTESVGGDENFTVLFGSLLAEGSAGAIYTGDIFDPTLVNNWAYASAGSGNPSYQTNLAGTDADQPWMLYNRGPANPDAQDVYVAYDDFSVNPVALHVTASLDQAGPPVFPAGGDKVVGTASGAINPGHRLAKDPVNGAMYSLFQNCIANCATLDANPKTINYMLNRTTDQGATWTLNGSSSGIVVATADSTQPQPKFGTVNALLGGVLHGAVDPSTGDLYYVYGNRDTSGNNRLAIRRVFDNGAGGVEIGPESFVVSGAVQAALPSIAITSHGTIAVFYYTFNGIVSNFPQFSTWLATSTDRGATFSTTNLATFLSPATDNGNTRQRVFGDYVQMKAIANCFYGSYTGNGAAFGRSFANNDPIFFKACVPGSLATNDLDGDGKSDVLWRKTGARALSIWEVNGSKVKLKETIKGLSGDWQVVGSGDFDGDGGADILWRGSDGSIVIWEMKGSEVKSAIRVGRRATSWQVAGTGDFDGDGKTDILWRNSNGAVSVWEMNGAQVKSSKTIGSLPTSWQIVGTGDFDGDGNTDILWHNSRGAVLIWEMDGVQVKSATEVGRRGASWQIVGTGDFDGDGMSDVLWRNSNGGVSIWEMDGTMVKLEAAVGRRSSSWQIVGTGDFDADGKSDILWHDTSGVASIWEMNGANLKASARIGRLSTAWQIQP